MINRLPRIRAILWAILLFSCLVLSSALNFQSAWKGNFDNTIADNSTLHEFAGKVAAEPFVATVISNVSFKISSPVSIKASEVKFSTVLRSIRVGGEFSVEASKVLMSPKAAATAAADSKEGNLIASQTSKRA